MAPIRKMLLAAGITEQQWRILRVLTETGPIDAGSLAKRACLLAPSLTLYYDFGLIDDFYITAGVAPEFPLGDQDDAPVLGLSASIGMLRTARWSAMKNASKQPRSSVWAKATRWARLKFASGWLPG